jgi:hypothetical protein
VPIAKLKPSVSRIIPGDWGKVGPGWLAQLLISRVERGGSGGRIHQFLWRRSRAVSKREAGTERRGAIRNRPGSSQVARRSFGSGRIAVTRGKRLLLCISTGGQLWRSSQEGQPAERRRKAGQKERTPREGHGVSAGPVKTFRNAGDIKNDTAGL